jgi:NADPH:quinone reductase-like Zn-dependent oxidoreductase
MVSESRRKSMKTSANTAINSLNDSPMRAYHLERLGSLAGLVAVEQEIPSPGAGDVLVRVRASSLNFRDLLIINGVYPIPVPPGRVPLSDAAGEIMAVGAGVARFKVGDGVINSFFPNWFGGSFNQMPDQYVANRDGWLTEYKVVSAEALVSMPALAGTGSGDIVLTEGTGGVSLFAVQLAKAMGARVIATTSSPEKARRLTELGADHVIDYRALPEWGDQVRALTGGRGVDRVVEVGGPDTLVQSIKAVAYGGQVSMVGVLGGAVGGLDFMTMFMSQATFRPIAIGSRRDLEEVCRVMKQHGMRPVIDSVFSFDDAAAALHHFADRQLFGKVVIRH